MERERGLIYTEWESVLHDANLGMRRGEKIGSHCILYGLTYCESSTPFRYESDRPAPKHDEATRDRWRRAAKRYREKLKRAGIG